jgi:transcriptional regulator with XRE-family HTH domain
MHIYKSTGRIVKLMEEKNVNIEDVCAATGVCDKRLKEYVAGRFDNISVTDTAQLAEYFNVSPSYLLGWAD